MLTLLPPLPPLLSLASYYLPAFFVPVITKDLPMILVASSDEIKDTVYKSVWNSF
jgi:hypothetical protein